MAASLQPRWRQMAHPLFLGGPWMEGAFPILLIEPHWDEGYCTGDFIQVALGSIQAISERDVPNLGGRRKQYWYNDASSLWGQMK